MPDFVRVLIVKGPARGIFVDVPADAIERFVIPDDVLIIIALPQPPPECVRGAKLVAAADTSSPGL
jgi:hypothetical protein